MLPRDLPFSHNQVTALIPTDDDTLFFQKHSFAG
jgi:hypothetical protein